MYDLLLQEGMWNAMALEEGKRSSSVLQVAVSGWEKQRNGTEWDKEVVGKVDPQKRVLCLAQVFLRCGTAFANGVSDKVQLLTSIQTFFLKFQLPS